MLQYIVMLTNSEMLSQYEVNFCLLPMVHLLIFYLYQLEEIEANAKANATKKLTSSHTYVLEPSPVIAPSRFASTSYDIFSAAATAGQGQDGLHNYKVRVYPDRLSHICISASIPDYFSI